MPVTTPYIENPFFGQGPYTAENSLIGATEEEIASNNTIWENDQWLKTGSLQARLIIYGEAIPEGTIQPSESVSNPQSTDEADIPSQADPNAPPVEESPEADVTYTNVKFYRSRKNPEEFQEMTLKRLRVANGAFISEGDDVKVELLPRAARQGLTWKYNLLDFTDDMIVVKLGGGTTSVLANIEEEIGDGEYYFSTYLGEGPDGTENICTELNLSDGITEGTKVVCNKVGEDYYFFFPVTTA